MVSNSDPRWHIPLHLAMGPTSCWFFLIPFSPFTPTAALCSFLPTVLTPVCRHRAMLLPPLAPLLTLSSCHPSSSPLYHCPMLQSTTPCSSRHCRRFVRPLVERGTSRHWSSGVGGPKARVWQLRLGQWQGWRMCDDGPSERWWRP